MRWLAIVLSLAAASALAAPDDWALVSNDSRAVANQRFQFTVIAPPGQTPPDEIAVRMRADPAEVLIRIQADAPAEGERRSYTALMPVTAFGPITLQLSEQTSNVLVILVSRPHDSMQAVTGLSSAAEEPPLSENDPVYFILGARDGYSARFQISFKYRLFDQGSGFGRQRPWLSGIYFGYTQNSLWDLSSDSKAFRDTSYRPSIFWKWERTDDRTWLDGARIGLEHESNGRDGERSRSINTAFVRPEWRWKAAHGATVEFTPKAYYYLDKAENPDIERYRGYVDWRVRYDTNQQWIFTAVARVGTLGKGSLLVDMSRRTRDMKIGPLSGYLHVQFFNGYGEDIVDYNFRRNAQLRVGLAIVP